LVAVTTTIVITLVMINWITTIVGAAWLIVLWDWRPLIAGVIVILISPIALTFVASPGSHLLEIPGARLFGRDHPLLGSFLIVLNLVYLHLLVTAWCLAVFAYYVDKADGDRLWPLALWSFPVATAPLLLMTAKDIRAGRGDGSAITLSFAQIAYLGMTGVGIFYAWPLITLSALFLAVMLLSVLAQTVLAIAFASQHTDTINDLESPVK